MVMGVVACILVIKRSVEVEEVWRQKTPFIWVSTAAASTEILVWVRCARVDKSRWNELNTPGSVCGQNERGDRCSGWYRGPDDGGVYQNERRDKYSRWYRGPDEGGVYMGPIVPSQ
jgi:hypothetical protein